MRKLKWLIFIGLIGTAILLSQRTHATVELKYSPAIEKTLKNRGEVGSTKMENSAGHFLTFGFERSNSTSSSQRAYNVSRGGMGSTIYMEYLYKSDEDIDLYTRMDETKNPTEKTPTSSNITVWGEYTKVATVENTHGQWRKIEIPFDLHGMKIDKNRTSGKVYQFPSSQVKSYGGPSYAYYFRLAAWSKGKTLDTSKMSETADNYLPTRIHLIWNDGGGMNTVEMGNVMVPNYSPYISSNFGFEVKYDVRDEQTLNPKVPIRINIPEHLDKNKNTTWIWGNSFDLSPEKLYTDALPSWQGTTRTCLKAANTFKPSFFIEQTENGSGTGAKFGILNYNSAVVRMRPGTLNEWLKDSQGNILETDYTFTNKGVTKSQTLRNLSVGNYTEAVEWKKVQASSGSQDINLRIKIGATVQLLGKVSGAPIEGAKFICYLADEGEYPIEKNLQKVVFTTDKDGKFTVDKELGLQNQGYVFFEQIHTLSGYKPVDLYQKEETNGNLITLYNDETETHVSIDRMTDNQTDDSSRFIKGHITKGSTYTIERYDGNNWKSISTGTASSTNDYSYDLGTSNRLKSGEKIRVKITKHTSLPLGQPVERAVEDVTPPTAIGKEVAFTPSCEFDDSSWVLSNALNDVKDEFNIDPANKITAELSLKNDEIKYPIYESWLNEKKIYDQYLKDLADFNDGKTSTEPIEPNKPDPICPVTNIDSIYYLLEWYRSATHGDKRDVYYDLTDSAGNTREVKTTFVANKVIPFQIHFKDMNGKELAKSKSFVAKIKTTEQTVDVSDLEPVVKSIENKNYNLVFFDNEKGRTIFGQGWLERNEENRWWYTIPPSWAVKGTENLDLTLIFNGTVFLKDYPSEFEFQPTTIHYGNFQTEVKDIKGDLVVWDNDEFTKSWELSASISKLYKEKSQSANGTDVLLSIVNQNGNKVEVSSQSGSVEIDKEEWEKGKRLKDEWNLSNEWKSDSSKCVLSFSSNGLDDGNYKAEITWDLSSTPQY